MLNRMTRLYILILYLLLNLCLSCFSQDEDDTDFIKGVTINTLHSECEVYFRNERTYILLNLDSSIVNNKIKHRLLNSLLIFKVYEHLRQDKPLVVGFFVKGDSSPLYAYHYSIDELRKLHECYGTSHIAPVFTEFIVNQLTNKEIYYYDRALEGLMMYRKDTLYRFNFIETVFHYIDDIDSGRGKKSYYRKIIKSIKIVMDNNEIVPNDVDVKKLDFFIDPPVR